VGKSCNCPFGQQVDQNGDLEMHSKVLVLVVCALAMAIVVHSLVYVSIDAASLSAEMPRR